jgi:hypothetical protein
MRPITRLAAMPGTKRTGALLALAAAIAAVSGCGSNEIGGQIPQTNADELNAALSGVQTAVQSTPPDCATAASDADQFVRAVNDLPESAGKDLKDALRDAGGNLEQLVSKQCTAPQTTTTTQTQPTKSSSTTSSSTTSSTSTSSTTTTSTSTGTTTTTQTSSQGGNQGGDGGGEGGGGDGGTGGGTGGTGG